MGLFDRFKRQAKEAVDTNKITIMQTPNSIIDVIDDYERSLA